MEITEYTHLKDLKKIQIKKFDDNRGSFMAFPNFSDLLQVAAAQLNLSISQKGVLRGMHHQVTKPQGKLVTCIKGGVLDLVFDNRKDSPTYGNGDVFFLSSPTDYLLVPRGYLHGFMSLENNSIFQYYVDEEYVPSDEETVSWKIMDKFVDWDFLENLGITKENLIISEKDNI